MQDNEKDFMGFEHLGLNLRPFKRGNDGNDAVVDNAADYGPQQGWQGSDAAPYTPPYTPQYTSVEESAPQGQIEGDNGIEPSGDNGLWNGGEAVPQGGINGGADGYIETPPSQREGALPQYDYAVEQGEAFLREDDTPIEQYGDDEPFFQPDEDEKTETIGEIKRKRKSRRVVTEREKIRRAKRAKAIRTCVLAVLAGAAAVAALLTYFLLLVDSIEIYGNTRYTGEEILESSGLKLKKHIWLQNTAEATKNLKQNVYVENAVITRVYPDKLVVNITEREEAAVLVGVNVQAVIDNKGYVLYIGARHSYDGLIQVSGMGSSGYHVGQRLGEESDFNSRTLVQLLDAVYSSGMESEITYIDMGNPLSVNMETQSGVTIHLGQPDNAEEKLNAFRIILPTLKAKGFAKEGTIDLSAKGEGVYSPPRTPEPIAPTPTIDISGEGGEPLVTEGGETGENTEPGATPNPLPQATPSPTDAFSG